MLVYIADDEEIIHRSLKETLNKQYGEVTYADYYKIRDLVMDLHDKKQDGTISDISLIFLDNWFDKSGKGVTGMDKLPSIRKQAPDTPIIFFTAEEDYSIVSKTSDFAEVRYLVKPLKPSQLYAAIDELLRDHKRYAGYEEALKESQKTIENLRGTLKNMSDEDQQIDVIYEHIKDNQEIIIRHNKEQYNVANDSLAKKYPGFDKKVLKFISTGEFLFGLLCQNKIDFSPVAIAYAKGVEALATRLLKKKGFLEGGKHLMLGEACNALHKKSLHIESWFLNELTAFKDLRNKVAHQFGVSRQDLDNMRKILFDDKTVKNGLDILKFFNDEILHSDTTVH